jgi:hypothetical protein
MSTGPVGVRSSLIENEDMKINKMPFKLEIRLDLTLSSSDFVILALTPKTVSSFHKSI